MSRLQILGVAAAVLVGFVHGLLAAMWDLAVDDGTSTALYPRGWTGD